MACLVVCPCAWTQLCTGPAVSRPDWAIRLLETQLNPQVHCDQEEGNKSAQGSPPPGRSRLCLSLHVLSLTQCVPLGPEFFKGPASQGHTPQTPPKSSCWEALGWEPVPDKCACERTCPCPCLGRAAVAVGT